MRGLIIFLFLLPLTMSMAESSLPPVEDLSEGPGVTYRNETRVERPIVDRSVERSAAAPAAEDSFSSPAQSLTAEDETDSDQRAQQTENLLRMNLPEQIELLRAQVQRLTGLVEEQAYALKQLKQTQQAFQQDVNQRLPVTGGAGVAASRQTKSAAAPSAQSGASLDETQQYQQALSYLTQKQYPKAITAFTAYARAFPRGQFAANTQYWLGELYYQQSDWPAARRAFEQVAKVDARSNKVPDAALKLALIQMKTGQVAAGKKALGALKQAYPNSTAAQLATIELQRAA